MSEIAKGWKGSSNIADVSYDAAPSPGKHFAAHIRGKYPSTKLGQEAA